MKKASKSKEREQRYPDKCDLCKEYNERLICWDCMLKHEVNLLSTLLQEFKKKQEEKK
jgi:ribosomal protein L32